MRGPPGQRGVALLTVLLVVFLATVAATSLATVQQFAIRRSTLLLHQQQALYYARGAETWALRILGDDPRDRDHPEEDWARHVPSVPVEGGGISGAIEDLQGRFNLNNLRLDPEPDPANPGTSVQRHQEDILIRLLENLDVPAPKAEAVARQLRDWVDDNQEPRFPQGAEDGAYVGRDPPYHTRDGDLVSVSELRLLKDMDPETYARLAPYASALPLEGDAPLPVNINTAAAAVVAAVLDIDPGSAANCLETRPPEGDENLERLLSCAGLDAEPRYNASLGVASEYFLIRIEAYVGEGRSLLTSLARRGDSAPPRIIRRSLNRWEP